MKLSIWRGSRERRHMVYVLFYPKWHGAKPKAAQSLFDSAWQPEKPQAWHVDENPLNAYVAEDLYLCT